MKSVRLEIEGVKKSNSTRFCMKSVRLEIKGVKKSNSTPFLYEEC